MSISIDSCLELVCGKGGGLDTFRESDITIVCNGQDQQEYWLLRENTVPATTLSKLITSDTSLDYQDTQMFCGMSAWYQKWLAKCHGISLPFSDYSKARMEQGKISERLILEAVGNHYSNRVPIYNNKGLYSRYIIGATPDAFLVDDAYKYVIEVKAPEFFAPKKDPKLWLEYPPQCYVMQLGIQMYVIGASQGCVVAGSENTGDVRMFRYCDQDFDTDIMIKSAKLWLDMVQAGRFDFAKVLELPKHKHVTTREVIDLSVKFKEPAKPKSRAKK